MKAKPYSIVKRLALWCSCSAFLITALSSVYLYWHLSKKLQKEDNYLLYERVLMVQSILNTTSERIEGLHRRISGEWILKDLRDIYVKVLDHTGSVVGKTPGLEDKLDAELFSKIQFQRAEDLTLTGAKRIETSDGNYLVFAQKLENNPQNGETFNIYLALSASLEDDVLKMLRYQILLFLCLASLLAIYIGRFVSVRGLAPVTEIVNLVKKIKSNNLHERLPTQVWPTEISVLAETFNEMIARLNESFDRLSRFSADIAHEIRTPLSSIAGAIEVTLGKERSANEYREVLISCLEEAMKVRQITESLLFIARAENASEKIQKESISVNNELKNIIDLYGEIASESGISLDFDFSGEFSLQVEKTLFQRAISNLLSNAIDHTAHGGFVTIKTFLDLPDSKSVGFAHITITDTGEGISQEHLKKIFERFYRVDPSRSVRKTGGYGLGLTIVKTIIDLHSGNIEIASKLGKGTSITLSFPIV